MIALSLLGQAVSIFPISALLIFALARLVSRRRPEQDGRGRAVLITGCDSGFGHRLALRLDRDGFSVFAGCLRAGGAGARSLRQQGSGRLKVLQLDVTSEDDVRSAKRTVLDNLPEKGLWAVVNNAGVTDWAEIEWSGAQDFEAVLQVNLLGCIRTAIAFLPLVRAAKGRMVFVSSILAFFHCPTMAAYSVSKRGLEAFADCLRVEMSSFGVQVSIIQPGNFGRATNILPVKTAAQIWDKLDDERKRTFNRRYVELAHDYFLSTCRSGFEEAEPVIEAMRHAVTSPRPRVRYLLASAVDAVFFRLFPLLPSVLADAVFGFSQMYAKRKEMLYAQ